MKYNSVENAEQFITEQIAWAKANGYNNLTIWSNGEELSATIDTNEITNIMNNAELKIAGFWKAIQFVNGHRVEF